MKIKKNIFAFLLSLVMILGMMAPVSAMEIGGTADIAGVVGNRAVVIGKAEDYAEKFITVLLLEGDGTDTSDEAILFMDTLKADAEGYYEAKIEYDGFTASNGIVDNCKLLVKAEGKDITDTVLSAEVKKSDMLAVDVKTSLGETSAQAIAKVNNLYGQNINSVMMIAAYDDNNKLIGVAKADKEISAETDEIKVTYENMPEKFSRLVAYVWESASTLIPYSTQKDVEYADNNIKTLVMNPGSDETKRRFVWYNDNLTYGAKIQYALKSDYDRDGGFTAANSIEVSGTTDTAPGNTTSVSCKVDIEDLELGKEYIYRVGNKYKYDDKVYTFKTYDPDNDTVQNFVMITDVHVNAYTIDSVEPDNSHVRTLNTNFGKILDRHSDIQFIASTGDNVSQGNMGDNFREHMNSDWEIYRQKAELEMEVLFAPELFRSIPWASSLGNHEANYQGEAYGSVTRWHYNLPNDDGVTGTVYSKALGAPNTHGNFWFRNGDVLVVGITAVQYENAVFPNSQPEDHVKYIQAAMDANKDAKWRVLINHVPPYSLIGGFAEPPVLRQRFADMNIDQFDFDVVFSGHQHSYSRSKQLLTDDDTNYQNITSSYGSNSGKTNKFIIPKVVSEDAIVRGTDENGYSYDVATNPEGAVHLNLSAFQWSPAGGNAHPDYTDFLEVIVTDEKHFKPQTIGTTSYGVHYSHTGADIIAENQPVEWHGVSNGTYMFVTVTKTDEGQEMKFEFRQISTGKILDTYIIKKTK